MLTEKRKEEAYRRLLLALESDRRFLDSHLTLESISSEVMVSRSALASVLCEKHISFTALVNSYRTSYAIDILLNSGNTGMVIDEVAELSGFGSTRSMNKHIRDRTGVTAGALRERVFGKKQPS